MSDADGLVAFLRERLDEEEQLANAASHAGLGVDVGPDGKIVSENPDAQDHIATWNPRRVLAEVEAKRRIVILHGSGSDPCDAHDASYLSIPCDTLLLLAVPYAGHPDYRPAWRP